jgi:hypothetical protein
MCHIMHSYGIASIIIMNLFDDTKLGALKHINIISSKRN